MLILNFLTELSMKVVAAVRSKSFIDHCLKSLIFQSSLMTYGRPEIYLFIPPYEYFVRNASHNIIFDTKLILLFFFRNY